MIFVAIPESRMILYKIQCGDAKTKACQSNHVAHSSVFKDFGQQWSSAAQRNTRFQLDRLYLFKRCVWSWFYCCVKFVLTNNNTSPGLAIKSIFHLKIISPLQSSKYSNTEWCSIASFPSFTPRVFYSFKGHCCQKVFLLVNGTN